MESQMHGMDVLLSTNHNSFCLSHLQLYISGLNFEIVSKKCAIDNKSQKKPKACRKSMKNLKESEAKFYSIKLEPENQPSLLQIAQEEEEHARSLLPLSPEMVSQYEQNIY